eukprot:2318147-Amphidinium_carterae.2
MECTNCYFEHMAMTLCKSCTSMCVCVLVEKYARMAGFLAFELVLPALMVLFDWLISRQDESSDRFRWHMLDVLDFKLACYSSTLLG